MQPTVPPHFSDTFCIVYSLPATHFSDLFFKPSGSGDAYTNEDEYLQKVQSLF